MDNEQWVEEIIAVLKHGGKNLCEAISIVGTVFCLLSLQAKEQLPREEFVEGLGKLTALYQTLLLEDE